MESTDDYKIITQYKGHTLKYPIYTSRKTQQIYDSIKNVKTCDSKGYVIVEVIDERNKYSGFRYGKFRRCALLKFNGDYDCEKEKNAPRYRYFDEHHKPFQ